MISIRIGEIVRLSVGQRIDLTSSPIFGFFQSQIETLAQVQEFRFLFIKLDNTGAIEGSPTIGELANADMFAK